MSINVGGTIVTLAVDRADTGIATAINTVLRRVGGGVGAQTAAALMASFTLAGGAPSGTAFSVTFGAGAAVAGLGVVCAALVRDPRTRRARRLDGLTR